MSVDFKTDYGAVGDGQIQTLTVSYATGVYSIDIHSNTFTGADVGKMLAVDGWVGPIPGIPTLLTISAVGTFSGGKQTLTMTGFFSPTTTVSSVPLTVEWGTDDTAAGTWFRAANINQTGVVLTVPAGRYCGASFGVSTVALGKGIPGLTVNGTGSPVFTDMLGSANGFGIGSADSPPFDRTGDIFVQVNAVSAGATVIDTTVAAYAVYFTTGTDISIGNPARTYERVHVTAVDATAGTVTIASPLVNSYVTGTDLWTTGTGFVRTQNITAGSTVIHMVHAGDAAIFPANRWAFLSGYETQGFGDPDPYYYEHVYVVASDGTAGTVTLSAPVRNSYKISWPLWVSEGFGRGPASLALMVPDWDGVHVYNGVGWRSTNTVLNAECRDITFNNCVFELFGPNISHNMTVAMDNISVANQWEFDKSVDACTISNSPSIEKMNFQNVSPETLTLDNVITSLNGTPKRMTATNCTFADATLTPNAYAPGETVTFSGCSEANAIYPYSGTYEQTVLARGWSMSGGILSRDKYGSTTGTPPQFAAPNHYVFIFSYSRYENQAYLITDAWEDDSKIYLSTNGSGGFPPLVSGESDYTIAAAPPLYSVTGCTGIDELFASNDLATAPQYSHWLMTYSGIGLNTFSHDHDVKIGGKLVSFKVTVNSGYSAGTFSVNDPFVMEKPANTKTDWNPVFNLTQTGTRTILGDGSVTGTQSGDSGLAPPNTGAINMLHEQMTAMMTSAVGTGSVTLEIQTDLGFSSPIVGPTPISARLRMYHSA